MVIILNLQCYNYIYITVHVLLCLVVCLTLLASSFLPSHLSLKHVQNTLGCNTFELCNGKFQGGGGNSVQGGNISQGEIIDITANEPITSNNDIVCLAFCSTALLGFDWLALKTTGM